MTPEQPDHASEQTPLTWTALLAHWTAVAQAATALPDEGDTGRLKRSLPEIIGLQAVAFAMADLDRIPGGERASAIDKASVLVRRHAAAINELWRGEPLPEAVEETIDDARLALRLAELAGLEWAVADEVLIADHPAELAAALVGAGFEGDLFLPTPGVELFEGCPAAFLRSPGGAPPDEDFAEAVSEFLGEGAEGPLRRAGLRQAYRQFDFSRGGPVRDVVALTEDSLLPGQPLLIPAVLGGEVQRVTLPPRGPGLASALPVEFEGAG